MSYKGFYKCSSCGTEAEILVETVTAPVHRCEKRLNKIYELEKDENRNRKRRQNLRKEVS